MHRSTPPAKKVESGKWKVGRRDGEERRAAQGKLEGLSPNCLSLSQFH
jgi:hypothetical protein